jgi:hypothetical protein
MGGMCASPYEDAAIDENQIDAQTERNASLLDFLMDPEEDTGPRLLKIKVD